MHVLFWLMWCCIWNKGVFQNNTLVTKCAKWLLSQSVGYA